jgi:hypothetical protein
LILTQAGQSENLSDQVDLLIGCDFGNGKSWTGGAECTIDSISVTELPYEPAVGDVVEFEYRNSTWTGLCLSVNDRISLTVDLAFDSGDLCWAYLREISKARFIKSSEGIPTVFDSWIKAYIAAKAYFAQPPAI